jgi:hypothetical protein
LRKDAKVRGSMLANPEVSLTNPCGYLLKNQALMALSHRRTNQSKQQIKQ